MIFIKPSRNNWPYAVSSSKSTITLLESVRVRRASVRRVRTWRSRVEGDESEFEPLVKKP